MASRTPAVAQNENFFIHRGNGPHAAKTNLPKPSNAKRQDRRALRDVSNTGKPSFGASKGTILKETVVQRRETAKPAPKSSWLSDEEIKKCSEWAKEGIEQTDLSGNDIRKLQQDKKEESIRKKVEKTMTMLHEWTDAAYDLEIPQKVTYKDTEEVSNMKIEPEVLPPMASTSDDQDLEDMLLSELDQYPFLDNSFEFKLKDDYDSCSKPKAYPLVL